MSNPFKKIQKNATETKKHWDTETKNSKISTKTCDCCGAPRPAKTNLTHCSYCQFQFMDIEATIKTDDSK